MDKACATPAGHGMSHTVATKAVDAKQAVHVNVHQNPAKKQ